MAKQNFGGVYANMDFPGYEYREFPKHIPTGPHGRYEIAANATEEEVIRKRLQAEADGFAAIPEFVHHTPDPEREALVSRAAVLGVPINKLWSITKLKSTIQAAEAAMDELPAEGAAPLKPTVLTTPGLDEHSASGLTPEEYKDKLIEEAKSFGLSATRLWGIPRLEQTIAEAKAHRAEAAQ